MELKYLIEVLKSFVEIVATLYQDILCFHFINFILLFHFICLLSGSINSKLKYSDNDFYYFLYAF